jgi:hypothetical protein
MDGGGLGGSIWVNGESLHNAVWDRRGVSAIEPSYHDIHCSCGFDIYMCVCVCVCMHMKMIILFWFRYESRQQRCVCNNVLLESYVLYLYP